MSPKPITHNTLFYGDNLPIQREYIANESVDYSIRIGLLLSAIDWHAVA